jgi:hypothetical protein
MGSGVGPHAQWRTARAAGTGITVYAAGLVNGQPVGTTDPEDEAGSVLEVDGQAVLNTLATEGLRISGINDRIIAH